MQLSEMSYIVLQKKIDEISQELSSVHDERSRLNEDVERLNRTCSDKQEQTQQLQIELDNFRKTHEVRKS